MARYDLLDSSSPSHRSSVQIVSDHVLMSLFLFCLAMAYVGLHGACHETLDRSQKLRDERQTLQHDIQRTQYLISLNTSSVLVQRWAFHGGFRPNPTLAFNESRRTEGFATLPSERAGSEGLSTASLTTHEHTNP